MAINLGNTAGGAYRSTAPHCKILVPNTVIYRKPQGAASSSVLFCLRQNLLSRNILLLASFSASDSCNDICIDRDVFYYRFIMLLPHQV